MNEDRDPLVRLEAWSGPWETDDPDANFKADVALYARTDPLVTIRGLAEAIRVPEGAIVHYILAKWASGGSGGLLELGPTMTRRLWAPIAAAEAEDSDGARLAAYGQLRQMIQWLMLPLDQEAGYDAAPVTPALDHQDDQDRANP
jgi:hypothetical protein